MENSLIFNVNAFKHSDGSFMVENGREVFKPRFAKADIHIPRTTNFTVDVEMRGTRGLGHIDGLSRFIDVKEFQPRSSALICTRNKLRPKSVYRKFKFGKRRDGDVLLSFQQEYVKSMDNNRLPRHRIEYKHSNVTFTSVEMSVNVSGKMYKMIWVFI